jgi:hypothetical protein
MSCSLLRPATRALVVILVCLVCSTLVFSQSTGGRILGRVSDPSGAVLAGVKVTLTNDSTGATRDSLTNESGDYVFLEVQPAVYSLKFEQSGFTSNVRKGVTLEVNQVITLNMTMQIGQTKEIVEVTSEAPLVETTSTQMGAVVNERAVSQLPLNSRDTYQLLSLQPGVQSQTGGDLYYGSDRAGVVSVNGGRGRSNNFSVNGGDANDQFANLPAVQPSPDSIQEFRVLTNTFDAEYGRNSGAVVNVVTKSGTNAFHGNVYEFFRNKVLNARGYFDPEKPDFKQNQFGGTFGGPIKKDRTFFFTSYEGRRIRQGIPSDSISVPSDQQRPSADQPFADFSDSSSFAGVVGTDFFASVLNNRPGCATKVAALSGLPIENGSFYGTHPRNPDDPESPLDPGIFTNVAAGLDHQQIPVECMDQTALDLYGQFVPRANIIDPVLGPLFQVAPIHRDRTDQFTAKVDHRINDRQNLSVYYYFNDSKLFDPFARFQAGGANVPGFGANTSERYQQWNLSHNWTITNSLVNEARFTYFREAQGTFLHPERTSSVHEVCKTVPADQCFSDPGNPRIGITPGLGPSREGVPFVSLSGGVSIGNNFEGEIPQIGNTFQWSDNLSWVKGSHTMKFGADVRRQRFDQTLFFNVNGEYFYFGGGPNDTVADTFYPNYLLGLPDTYIQGSAQTENVRSTIFALFAQDSWKIKPSLTLNYGLRWELQTPLADISHRVQTFRPGQETKIYPCQLGNLPDGSPNPLIAIFGSADCTPGGAAAAVNPLGLVIPGDQGIPNGLTSTYYKAFAPRLGIAWTPSASGKTVIRTGWGLFYNPMEQLVLEQFSAEPPFGGSNSINFSLFNTPFVDQQGNQKPNPFNGILNPQRGNPVDWSVFRPMLMFGQFQPHLRTQYTAQYNLNIQRELMRDLVLQVGYVGSQGHRLLASHDINFSNPQTCLDLHNMSIALDNGDLDCGQYSSELSYFVPPGTVLPNDLHLPYGSTPVVNAGTTVGPAGITLVGLRPYSSPLCEPLTGVNCPPDSTPVFSSIFAEDTIANSNYNSLQVMLEKRFSHGLQTQVAYTWSKSFDLASSFEGELNPTDFHSTYSLSQFDARHRLVFSYYYELPIPKYQGIAGKILNGWDLSGIYTYQTGFPVRIYSQADNELMNSFFFELPGQPDQLAPFKILDPKKNYGNGTGYWFDPNSFTENASDNTQPPCSAGAVFNCFQPSLFGRIGNTKRTLCCGPPINNLDFALHKVLPIGEKNRMEFRAELFNVFNHTQFHNPDGVTTDGSDFGRIKRARDPRLVQFALKFFF